MNAIQSVLSGNSSQLPEWLFNIVKHICEHPDQSGEKEIAEIIDNEFGKASDGKASDGKARGGKASDRKASERRARKSKKISYNRKRTQRK